MIYTIIYFILMITTFVYGALTGEWGAPIFSATSVGILYIIAFLERVEKSIKDKGGAHE